MRFRASILERGKAAAALLLVVTAAGCGGDRLYPVQGRVTFEDGRPLTKGMVVFESQGGKPETTARGEIQPDGSYQLATLKPGDGVPAGKYKVLIAPIAENPDAPPPALFDKRFSYFSTSGLEFEVKGGSNDFPIQVTKRPR